MSWIQRLFVSVLPPRRAASMEAHSRSWLVRCPCGFARSVWDIGGIRWKAAGEPRWLRKCPQCGQRTWHKVSREAQAVPPSSKG